MGGTKTASKPEGYDQNQAEIEKLNLDNERQMRSMMYYSGRDAAQMSAQAHELKGVNEQMTQAMTDAQKTISGYESQERRRLFEAKKGSGQVSDEDTAITQDMYDAAKKTITGGSDSWEEQRQQAIMRAGEGGWTLNTGTLEEYINKGSYATQTREAGKDYAPTNGKTLGNAALLNRNTRNRGSGY